MKLKCQCGCQFDVPDGTDVAQCPECGKPARAAGSDDWLESLDVGELALEGGEAEEPAAPAAAKPDAARPAGEGTLDLQAPAAPPRPATRPAPRPGSRKPPTTPEPLKPPEGLLELLRLFKNEPKDIAPFLEDGISSRRFSIEMGIALLGMGLIGGVLTGWLRYPRDIALGQMLGLWIRLLIEAAAGGALLALLAILLKCEAGPLGVAQGAAFVRILALIVVAPLALLLAIGTLATLGADQPPRVLGYAAEHLSTLYLAVVALGQSFLVTGILKLGCGPSLAIGVVTVYAAATLADTIMGIL